MNHALAPIHTLDGRSAALVADPRAASDETARLRRLRSLLALFALYAGALLAVIVLSDGADVGSILVGIAGHVLYATYRMVTSWRDASQLERVRGRVLARRQLA